MVINKRVNSFNILAPSPPPPQKKKIFETYLRLCQRHNIHGAIFLTLIGPRHNI